MADDRHYVPGDFYRIDERSGFKVRASRTRKEWTGRIVRDQSFEFRQPQDLVRGVVDDQTVPDPRPRQTNVFTFVTTTMAATAVAGAASISLTSTAGMTNGDTLGIATDSGGTQRVTLGGLPSSSVVTISPHLISQASAGNGVVDITTIPPIAPQNFGPGNEP